jgi:hypothetical protein
MSTEVDGTVRHEVVVGLTEEQAFWADVDLDQIEPPEHSLLPVPISATVLEQHAGGHVDDRGIDGSICRWGRVLVFDSHETIPFSWDIGPDRQVMTDGPGWEAVRDGVVVPAGWRLYLARYQALTRADEVSL